MDQFVHVRGLLPKRKRPGKVYDYVKTVYVDTNPGILNFGNGGRMIVKVGVASRHYKDDYVKKVGRELAKSKTKEVLYKLYTLNFVTEEEEPEHYIVTLTLNSEQHGPPIFLKFKSVPGKPEVFLVDAIF